jgi:hypothetical protein
MSQSLHGERQEWMWRSALNFFNNGWFLKMDRLTNHEEHGDAQSFLKIIMNSFPVPFVIYVVKLLGVLT